MILTETDGASVETCTSVDTCGASVGGYFPTPVKYAHVDNITFK